MHGIAFTITPSPLGLLLVAGTERGICWLRFGDDASELERSLALEFPFATLVPGDVEIKPWTDAVVAYLEGSTGTLAVPLDVRGSRFQRRVWQALREIPRGETRTYKALAAAIGKPAAARAVARACSTNPTPVIVPCHRVVPSAGGVGQYLAGTERKRKLLELESSGGDAGQP